MITLISGIADIRAALRQAKLAGRRVGFVPTMGALHAGHAALIRHARSAGDYVVVSIFVNPTQFGPNEDFSRYPRTLDSDRELCEAVGADAIFFPTVDEMYPPGSVTHIEVDLLTDHLCGPSRPGHFRGVATVVAKLFNIVQPDFAVFGRKDAQQCRVIQRMVRDLDMPVEVILAPTVRESDGLALSSRNRYLSPKHREQAPVLSKAIRHAQALVAAGERHVLTLEAAVRKIIAEAPDGVIDYVSIVDDETLQPVATLLRPGLLALAVFFEKTRLIDNGELVWG